MIALDPDRSPRRMNKDGQGVGAAHDAAVRAHRPWWVCRVSFGEPILATTAGGGG